MNNRLELSSLSAQQAQIDQLYDRLEKRIDSSPIRTCPVDIALGSLSIFRAQSCGKCTPCREGLAQLTRLMKSVLDNNATEETLKLIEDLSESIRISADCVIGTTAAEIVQRSLRDFRDDYLEHVRDHNCLARFEGPVPCRALCPAGVDIPGYIALVAAGRSEDAVKLIRKDNPFPSACAYICEHPCESHCRRSLVDDAVNIRGLKRYAVDNAGEVPAPKKAAATGKKVAVLGGGPAGLTAAYYLSVMGHSVTVYEMRDKLGGMLRYGIPEYRLPKAQLDKEIEYIISTGIEVKTGVKVGTDISLEELREKYDSIFVTIGAHNNKKLGVEGEDAAGVISAVKFLADVIEGNAPDLKGKKVVVVGGGNVAMDVTRTSVRLGARSVTCVYRRRAEDMTALPEEVHGAQEEGAIILSLHAPVGIKTDAKGRACALLAQPQITGPYDRGGRPSPRNADKPCTEVEADLIILAIGQDIDSAPFGGMLPLSSGKFIANSGCAVTDIPGIFAGGDCVTGPATVIKAIAAGKTAAANIDKYLGYEHLISTDVEIPAPVSVDPTPCGRAGIEELDAVSRKGCFDCIECGMSTEAAMQEASRCLRCDHYGFGAFRGGRTEKW